MHLTLFCKASPPQSISLCLELKGLVSGRLMGLERQGNGSTPILMAFVAPLPINPLGNRDNSKKECLSLFDPLCGTRKESSSSSSSAGDTDLYQGERGAANHSSTIWCRKWNDQGSVLALHIAASTSASSFLSRSEDKLVVKLSNFSNSIDFNPDLERKGSSDAAYWASKERMVAETHCVGRRAGER